MKAIHIRAVRCAIAFGEGIEALEERSLLSAPYEFASVGVRFDAGAPAVFEMLGQLGADGAVSGAQTLATLAGVRTGPIDWATYQTMSRRAVTTPGSGIDPYSQQSADNFLADMGFSFGSLVGSFGDNAPTDTAFLLQRPDGRVVRWESSGHYQFQYLQFDSNGFAFHEGVFFLDQGAPGVVTWSDAADGSDPRSINVSSEDDFGSLYLADGRHLHAAPAYYPIQEGPTIYAPGTVAIIVDADNTDGTIGIGIARQFVDFIVYPNAIGASGVYRSTILTGGPLADQFFGAQSLPGTADAKVARVAIQLSFDGTYAIYDQAAYDAGDRTALSSGTWTLSDTYVDNRRAQVVLTADSDGARAYFMYTAGHSLIARMVTSAAGDARDEMMGTSSELTPLIVERYWLGGHVSLDQNGHPMFYEALVDDYSSDPVARNWYSQDLLALWGGKPLVAVDSMLLAQDMHTYMVLGVSADGDVQAWERTYNGRWIYRNMTQELGTPGTVSDITIFDYRSTPSNQPWARTPALAIAGKSADGDIVMYTPDLSYNFYGVHPWDFINVTDDGLTPSGEEAPVWTGAVQGYQTSWDGMNIVGLDADGQLVVVWTAPGLQGWRTTNISLLAGSPPLVGSISVLLTYWDGIHIEALDADGAVHSTWWVPQLGADWAHNDLTEELNGPPLDTSRNTALTEAFITFVGVGNTLNIVGYDADGRVKVYWWSPASNVWLVGDITNSFPVADAPLGFASTDSVGSVDPNDDYADYGQSLYGYNSDASFSRVWWAPGGPDLWHVENLTAVAIPFLS